MKMAEEDKLLVLNSITDGSNVGYSWKRTRSILDGSEIICN
jgi:hypothetical protein